MKKTETKEFKLDLSVYTVPGPTDKEGNEPEYPLRENLSDFLRTAGMFKDAVSLVDGVILAKQIRNRIEDFIILDAKETRMLKSVVDTLIARTADGKANLGGLMHEELICRVVNMEEITE